MKFSRKALLPDRVGFKADPIGYSALAWHKWGMAQTLEGFPVDISKPPTSDGLKDPVLWLTHAHAMAESARILLQGEPNWESMPLNLRGVCDCQYCAVGMMLVGYSLEICLKAMLIIQKGIDVYTSEEKRHYHHRLVELAEFLPGLSEKDKAILRALTHFTLWAGRYPDPGAGREKDSEGLFYLSETYKISGKDLFELASRVMQHTTQIVEDGKL